MAAATINVSSFVLWISLCAVVAITITNAEGDEITSGKRKFDVQQVNRTDATFPTIVHKENAIFYTSFVPVIFKLPTPVFSKYISLHKVMCQSGRENATSNKIENPKLTYEEQVCLTLKNLSGIFELLQSSSFMPLPQMDLNNGLNLDATKGNTNTNLISCDEISPHFETFKMSNDDFIRYQERLKECFFGESIINFPVEIPDPSEFDKLIQSAMNKSFSPNRLYSSVLQDIAVNSYLSMQQSSILNLQMARSKWSNVFSACRALFIPADVINHVTLQMALSVVNETIVTKNMKFSIINGLYNYYNLPLTNCVMLEDNVFIIRILIPLLKTEEHFSRIGVSTTPHIMAMPTITSTHSPPSTATTSINTSNMEPGMEAKNQYYTVTYDNFLICEPNSVQDARILSSVKISEMSRSVTFSRKFCAAHQLCFVGGSDTGFFLNECLVAAYENIQNEIDSFPAHTHPVVVPYFSSDCQNHCNKISYEMLPVVRQISSNVVVVAGSLGNKMLVVCDNEDVIPGHWIEFNETETIEIELPCDCQLEYGFSPSIVRSHSPCDNQTSVITVSHLNLEINPNSDDNTGERATNNTSKRRDGRKDVKEFPEEADDGTTAVTETVTIIESDSTVKSIDEDSLQNVEEIQKELNILWTVVVASSLILLSFLAVFVCFIVRFRKMKLEMTKMNDNGSTFYSFSDIPIMS